MFDGSSPQSWMHSYLCSPSPKMGYFVPVLSAAITNGATAPAAPATRKLRRVVVISRNSLNQAMRTRHASPEDCIEPVRPPQETSDIYQDFGSWMYERSS